ncbi:hypothetical protein FACS1894132_08580 [Clostridia bacterium]|nr:hypothetical protein FACS1894132_08580 [Clostridia bacterium]
MNYSNVKSQEGVGRSPTVIRIQISYCVEQNLPFNDVLSELDERSKKIGNCKIFNQVDKNS